MSKKPYSAPRLAAAALIFVFPQIANATNGMNLEGYGPIATAMGGASMAYDNGTAAVMNNPATLALAPEGHRADFALGMLGPNVDSSASGQTWGSSGDAYYMPAFGWSRVKGDNVWGVGVFAQGGMGTDYSMGPGAAFSAMAMSSGGTATGLGSPSASSIANAGVLEERSEVGVGRLIFPLAHKVNDKLTVGGSLDLVWASLDLKMAMPGAKMISMMGSGLIDGSMVTGLQTAMGAGQLNDVYYGYFDFSNNNDYTGQASSTGYAGKLGVTYRINDKLTLGAVYQAKTHVRDMDGRAKVSMAVSADTGYLGGGANSSSYTDAVFPLSGTIYIRDFQWPEIFAGGLAYQATPDLMLVADLKQIVWSEVMKQFRMSFIADNSVANGAFAGMTMNATLPQNWDDQTVVQLGAAYRLDGDWTIRGGYNRASNPVPDATVHYLFPAIVVEHYTGGVGYRLNENTDIHFSMTHVPANTVTSTEGISIRHSQTNWQLLYSQRY